MRRLQRPYRSSTYLPDTLPRLMAVSAQRLVVSLNEVKVKNKLGVVIDYISLK